jgi:hypothetical protein
MAAGGGDVNLDSDGGATGRPWQCTASGKLAIGEGDRQQEDEQFGRETEEARATTRVLDFVYSKQ